MGNLELFVNFILPLLVLSLGIVGNTLGFILLLSRRLANLPTRKLYFYLLLIDSIYVSQIVVNFLESNFNFKITTYSVILCKFFSFFNYSLASLSPMLLVYISVDRLIAIKYPEHKFLLRSNKNQITYLFLIILFNFIYYFPFTLLLNLFPDKNPNQENVICSIKDDHTDFILLIMDLINRICVPFILMTVSSILLVITIFKSRARVFKNYLSRENRLFKRDIKLAITSLSLNIIYMLLNLPITIAEFSELENSLVYNLNLYLFYLSYSINFFNISCSNSIIRNEVFFLLKIKGRSFKLKQVVV